MSNLHREHGGHVKHGQLHKDIFHPPPTHAEIQERLRTRRIARAVKPPPKAPAPPVLFPEGRSTKTITDDERWARVKEYEEKKEEHEHKYRKGWGGVIDRMGLGSGKGTTPTRKNTTSTRKTRDDSDSDDDDVAAAADNTKDAAAESSDSDSSDSDSDDGYASPMDDMGWGLKEGVVKLRI